MATPSSPNQLLAFCNDCECLRLRDVTKELQELFTKHSDINADLCGICSKSIQNDIDKKPEASTNQDTAAAGQAKQTKSALDKCVQTDNNGKLEAGDLALDVRTSQNKDVAGHKEKLKSTCLHKYVQTDNSDHIVKPVASDFAEDLRGTVNQDVAARQRETKSVIKKYVQTDSIRKHEAGDSAVFPQATVAVQTENKDISVQHKDHSLTIKTEAGFQVQPINSKDSGDGDSVDHDVESSHSIVDIPLENPPVATSRSSKVTLSTKSTVCKRAAKSKVTKVKRPKLVKTKKLRHTNVATRSKVKCEPSRRIKVKREVLDTGTGVRQAKRVTRTGSGVIKTASYGSMFEGDKSDGSPDGSEEEEKEGEDGDDDDYQVSGDDIDAKDSADDGDDDGANGGGDDGDNDAIDNGDDDDDANGGCDDGDIDISKYIVCKNESELGDDLTYAITRAGLGVEILVPVLRELVVPRDKQCKFFKCKLCDGEFKYISQFHRHATTLHVEETGKIDLPFVCAVQDCGKKFASYNLVQSHKQCQHEEDSISYKCVYKNCKFTFNRKGAWMSHLQVHRGRKKFQCPKCGVGFTTQTYLSVHMSEHSGKGAFSCQFCSKKFGHQVSLLAHERNQHVNAGKFRCELCSYTCAKKTRLKSHRVRVHSQAKTDECWQCKQCKVTYLKKWAHDKHVKADKCRPKYIAPKQLHHTKVPVVEEDSILDSAGFGEVTKNLSSAVVELMDPVAKPDIPFKCKACPDAEFKYVSCFVRHLRKRHAELRPDMESILKTAFQCHECDQSFSLKAYLNKHQTVHATESIYKCEHPGCGMAFTNEWGLLRHGGVHRERQYMCDQCGGRFRQKGELAHHEKSVHQKLRPHVCPHCGLGVTKKIKLKAHIDRVHLKLKPCICDQCGRAFSDVQDLRAHMRYHTGEKPYKCDQCDYRCIRADYLRKHKRTHTKEKPYHCDLCNTAFAHRTQFVTHKKKTHGVHEDGRNADSQICGLQEGRTSDSSHQMQQPAVVNSRTSTSSSFPSILSHVVGVLGDDGNNEMESKTAVQYLHHNYNFYPPPGF